MIYSNQSPTGTTYCISLMYLSHFFFFFWPRHAACRILVPQQGIDLRPRALEAWCPNHWTARKFPLKALLIYRFPLHVSSSLAIIYWEKKFICLVDFLTACILLIYPHDVIHHFFFLLFAINRCIKLYIALIWFFWQKYFIGGVMIFQKEHIIKLSHFLC